MKTWIKDKIFIKDKLISEISKLDKQFKPNNLYFSEHHLSHAAAAFTLPHLIDQQFCV